MKPKRYRAFHIVPGIVEYSENGQKNTVLIKKEALDRMNPSFIGKPVFNLTHKVINADEAFNFTDEEKEKHAVGVVSDVGYDVETGYYSTDLMIWDEDTIKNIEKGFTVSCAYIPNETGAAGIYNNVQYDEEVINGEYHHMAIVEHPRYNEAKIFQNSKNGGVMKFKLNFLKKNELPAEPVKKPDEQEEIEMNADAVIETPEGEKIPVSELIANYKASQNAAPAAEDKTLSMDDTVDVDGKEVSIKELYENYKAKKNAEPATTDPLEPSVDPNMKKNSVEKPNENFKLIKNAADRGADPEKPPKPETEKNRIERGKARYGSVVENKGDK